MQAETPDRMEFVPFTFDLGQISKAYSSCAHWQVDRRFERAEWHEALNRSTSWVGGSR
jgi:hypothetical protein